MGPRDQFESLPCMWRPFRLSHKVSSRGRHLEHDPVIPPANAKRVFRKSEHQQIVQAAHQLEPLTSALSLAWEKWREYWYRSGTVWDAWMARCKICVFILFSNLRWRQERPLSSWSRRLRGTTRTASSGYFQQGSFLSMRSSSSIHLITQYTDNFMASCLQISIC